MNARFMMAALTALVEDLRGEKAPAELTSAAAPDRGDLPTLF